MTEIFILPSDLLNDSLNLNSQMRESRESGTQAIDTRVIMVATKTCAAFLFGLP